MKKTLANFIRGLLVTMLLAIAAMSIWWFGRGVEYFLLFLGALYIDDAYVVNLLEITINILSTFVITPLACVFIMSFLFPYAIERDMLFCTEIAKTLKCIGIVVVCDCTVLCVAFTVMLFLRETLLSPALVFVGALGITVGCMLLVLSKYVKHAAQLKEEAEYTL